MFAASKLHGPKPSYSKGGRPARGGETRGIVYDGRGDCEGLATTKVQKSRSSDRIDAFPASLRSPARRVGLSYIPSNAILTVSCAGDTTIGGSTRDGRPLNSQDG
jgi:hypothetical protein